MNESITGARKPPAFAKRISTITSPVRKFINDPAARMMSRFHTFWLVKARASSESPSSPSMAQ